MKKFNMAIAAGLVAAFFSVVNAQAQSEQVINLMPVANAQVSQDAANVAAEDGLIALEMAMAESKANRIDAARSLRGDTIFATVANSTMPVKVYWRSIEGFSFGAFAGAETFEGQLLPTVGIKAGWEARTWFWGGFARIAKGETTGDDDASFLKTKLGLEAGYTVVAWGAGHNKVSLLGEIAYTRRLDYRKAESLSEGGDQLFQSLDVWAHTLNFGAGIKYQHKSWAAKGLNWFVEVKGSAVTNLNINNKQNGNTLKPCFEATIGFEIFPSRGTWNEDFVKSSKMSKKAIKAAARKAVANY